MAGTEQTATMPMPEIEPGKAESWVQLLPVGTVKPKDGRGPWHVRDMAAIITASSATLKRGMPVDMDHALERRWTSEAPAAGWIEELAAREDGIWGRIAWTPTGKAKIEGREYRFISPVIAVSRAGEVKSIKCAGLTNEPALTMKAICSAEGEPVEDDPPKDEPMDEAAIIATLREAMGAPADMPVPELIRRARAIIATADTTRSDNAAAKELASSYMNLLAEVHEGRVEAVIERCRAEGKVVPAIEDWAYELASTNLPAFERWAVDAPVRVSFTRQIVGSPPPELLQGRFRGNTERVGVFRQLGLDE